MADASESNQLKQAMAKIAALEEENAKLRDEGPPKKRGRAGGAPKKHITGRPPKSITDACAQEMGRAPSTPAAVAPAAPPESAKKGSHSRRKKSEGAAPPPVKPRGKQTSQFYGVSKAPSKKNPWQARATHPIALGGDGKRGRRADLPETGRRRGRDVHSSAGTSRGDAVAATWIVRGDDKRARAREERSTDSVGSGRLRHGCDADIPWRRVAATPWLRRGYSAETSRTPHRYKSIGLYDDEKVAARAVDAYLYEHFPVTYADYKANFPRNQTATTEGASAAPPDTVMLPPDPQALDAA